eukprot:8436602-Alexandrium_andersonii.AAC.1
MVVVTCVCRRDWFLCIGLLPCRTPIRPPCLTSQCCRLNTLCAVGQTMRPNAFQDDRCVAC